MMSNPATQVLRAAKYHGRQPVGNVLLNGRRHHGDPGETGASITARAEPECARPT